jgi:bacteriocin-like protein
MEKKQVSPQLEAENKKQSTEMNDEELRKVSGGGERPMEYGSGGGAGTAVIAII